MSIEVTQEIKDCLDLIDTKYRLAKEKKFSRFSIEWGKWSRKMNLEIRRKLESGGHPQEVLYRYIFIYWVNRSQLLELHFKFKHKGSLKKQRAREGKRLKQIILSGDAPDALTNDDMIRALFKK